MHSDSHLTFDRRQLSAAVESLLCNSPILRLHTGDKPYERQTVYEWFYSIVMILCYLIKIDFGETNGCSLQAIPYAFFFFLSFFIIVGYICFPKLRLTENN